MPGGGDPDAVRGLRVDHAAVIPLRAGATFERMRTTSRRRLDAALVVGGSLAIGAVALVGAVAGDTERVERLWTSAELADDGSAQITEVIDYDFGSSARSTASSASSLTSRRRTDHRRFARRTRRHPGDARRGERP